jgi:N4-gp56 family major capsid protein
MPITTTSVLPSPVQQSFSYKLLSVPVPNMIHKIPAMHKAMPRNGGRTLRMRRYNPLATAMVPLGNSGVTPPPQLLTAVDKLYVHVKSFLIDLKSYGESYGNKAEPVL